MVMAVKVKAVQLIKQDNLPGGIYLLTFLEQYLSQKHLSKISLVLGKRPLGTHNVCSFLRYIICQAGCIHM